MSRDDELCPRFGLFKRLLQQRSQFGEQRHGSAFVALVMFRLGTRNKNLAAIPVDVLPFQTERFARNSDAAESRQTDQQTPFGIR